MRTILSGIIQKGGSTYLSISVNRIMNDFEKLIDDSNHALGKDLKDILHLANTAFFWGSGKTSMPFVFGMFWNPRDIKELGYISVICDALFWPMLVFHNLNEEIANEKIPLKGFDGHGIYTEVTKAVLTVNKILNQSHSNNLLNSFIWKKIEPILLMVSELYLNKVPGMDMESPLYPDSKPFQSYRRILQTLFYLNHR